MKKIMFLPLLLSMTIHGFSQFKADMEMKMAGDEVVYTVYSDKSQYRYEFNEGSQLVVLLITAQQKKTIMLIPDQKFYMSGDAMMGKSGDPLKNYDDLKASGTAKIVGEETIEGYVCEKRELYKDNVKAITVWFSEKLNFPVKMIDHAAGLSMTLKNIEKWEVDPSYFVVPENYKNMMW